MKMNEWTLDERNKSLSTLKKMEKKIKPIGNRYTMIPIHILGTFVTYSPSKGIFETILFSTVQTVFH